MSTEIIKVENLTFSHNGTEALSDISFTVRQGDYLGIVGPNGSGKNTLIKNILGILQPQSVIFFIELAGGCVYSAY